MTERLTPNQLPSDWSGSLGPITFGDTQIGIHRRDSVIGSICASTLASAVALGAQLSGHPMEGVLAVDASYTHTRQIVTSERIARIRNDAELVSPLVTEQIGSIPTYTNERRRTTFNLTMPDVVGMSLSQDPTAQVITNRDVLTSWAINFKVDEAEGWKVADISIHGNASDEMRSSPNAGIGSSDGPAMASLAKEYGSFVSQEVTQELAAKNILVPNEAVSLTSSEAVLDSKAQIHFKSVLEAAGYTSMEDFIRAYKTAPAEMSKESRAALKVYLDDKRGAEVTVYQSRFSQEDKPVIKTTSVTRCVDSAIIDRATALVDTKYGGDLPLLLLPYAAFKIRRRPEDEKGGSAQPTAANNEVAPAVSSMPAIEAPASNITAELPYHVASDMAGPIVLARGRHRYDSSRPRPRSFAEDYRRNREIYIEEKLQLSRRLNKVVSGVALTVLLATVVTAVNTRLDVGYCPDPENFKEQPFEWSKGLPDVGVASWDNPFTGNVTELGVLFGGMSCGNQQSSPNSYLPPTSTCDEREFVYKDNRLVSVWESKPNPNSQTKHVTIE